MSLRKRRTSDSAGQFPKRRRDGGKVSHGYVDLLNEMIAESNHAAPGADAATVLSTVAPLDSRRHDSVGAAVLQEYAATPLHNVTSNAVFERLTTEKALLAGLEGLESNHEHRRLLKPWQIPAAAEIGTACCEAIEDSASHLRNMEMNEDAQREMRRRGAFWLIDEHAADDLEHLLKENRDEIEVETMDDDPNPRLLSDVDHTLQRGSRLMCPRAFVRLSKLIFMNSSTVVNETIYDQGDSNHPSMYASCFLDFYGLTTALMRKLVASSLFQARSRLRATAPHASDRRKSVTQQDVLSAVDVLGIARDSVDYWLRLPRRLGLNVYEHDLGRRLKSKGTAVPLEYDEVERRLQNRSQHQPLWPAHVSPGSGYGHGTIGRSDIARSERQYASATNSGEPEIALEHYMALHDERHSEQSEILIWQALGKDVPPHLNGTTEKEPTFRATGGRLRAESREWRGRCKYKSAWESVRELGKSEPPAIARRTPLRSRRPRQRRGRSSSRDSSSLSRLGASTPDAYESDSDESVASLARSSFLARGD